MIGLRRRPGRTVLVLGGARSGKSRLAEQLLARERAVCYVACGPRADRDDPEWAQRVAEHRRRRPAGWTTLETRDLSSVLGVPGPPVLVEGLTTWLAGVMDDVGVWTAAAQAEDRLAEQIQGLLTSWAGPARRVVMVSNEVGCGVVPGTASGRRFRDDLGALNAAAAATADQVWLVTAGLPRRLK